MKHLARYVLYSAFLFAGASEASSACAQAADADGPAAEAPSSDSEGAFEDAGVRPSPRPLWAINAGFGYAGGGDDLVTAVYTDGSDETLAAGTGFSFSIGTTIEPLRFGAHALGAGFDFGIKGWNIGGSDADFQLTLTRLPIQVTAQYTYDFERTLALLVAGGLQHETSVNLSGSGVLEGLDASFGDATGWLAEAGILLGVERWAIDLTLRYTDISYSGNDLIEEVDAASFGIFAAFHYRLIMTDG